MNHDLLKKAAEHTYGQLKDIFSKSRNYWRLGHTFDTIIDYFVVTNRNDGEAGAFGKLALERYAACGGSWYDDFAWWAIANLKASQQKGLFGEGAGKFCDHRVQCWDRVALCTAVWDQAQSIPKFQPFKPAVEHGVWNPTYNPDDRSPNNLQPTGRFFGGLLEYRHQRALPRARGPFESANCQGGYHPV